MYEYRAKLDWGHSSHPVYDADSVRLIVDFGFQLQQNIGMVRLYGINAPEMRGPSKEAGRAARDYLRGLLPDRDHLEPDQWFTIKTHLDRKGKYGRYLVTLYRADHNLNKHLVSANHAVEYHP